MNLGRVLHCGNEICKPRTPLFLKIPQHTQVYDNHILRMIHIMSGFDYSFEKACGVIHILRTRIKIAIDSELEMRWKDSHVSVPENERSYCPCVSNTALLRLYTETQISRPGQVLRSGCHLGRRSSLNDVPTVHGQYREG